MIMLNESRVHFDELTHTYELDGRMLSGITPVVGWLFPETYKDIPEAVLAKAAEYGTMVHKQIELADTLGVDTDENARIYMEMRRLAGCIILRNEYLVTDGDKYASSIDLVMADATGVVLGDIKTTSQLHRDNVRVQLSLYAYLFELMNPSAKVTKLVAVWLPKPQYGRPEWVKLDRIPSGLCEWLLKAYDNGADPAPWRAEIGMPMPVKADDTLPVDIREVEKEIANIEEQAKQLKAKSEELRAGLLRVFEENNVKKYDGEFLTITRKEASTREDFDKKAFQQAHPDMYAKFVKKINVKSSLLIKVK